MRVSGEVGPDRGRLNLVGQYDGRRIDVSRRRYENHALAPLREKGERVDHSVRPPIATLLECLDQYPHRPPLIEVEHEADVFEDYPRYASIIQEAKYVADKPGSLAADPERLTCLAEVLTGEATHERINVTRK